MADEKKLQEAIKGDIEKAKDSGETEFVSRTDYKKLLDMGSWIVVAILLVLVLGFLTLLTQVMTMAQESNQFKEAAYEQLNTNINQLNLRLESQK